MDDCILGKVRIQELVAASAEELGIDTKNFIFKWDVLEGMILPEHGIQLKEKIYILKIYFGRRSQAITFAEPLVRKSTENPKAFESACKDSIVTTIRKLKRPDRSKAA